MTKFGIGSGLTQTNQGSKLARSAQFRTMLQQEFQYIVEPTSADCPSQNGAAEINNDKLAVLRYIRKQVKQFSHNISLRMITQMFSRYIPSMESKVSDMDPRT